MSSHDLDAKHCERCLVAPAFGLLSLHAAEGHHIAGWWTCCECADRDAPVHTGRGMRVSVLVTDVVFG